MATEVVEDGYFFHLSLAIFSLLLVRAERGPPLFKAYVDGNRKG
jgi:hypothetical protein